MGNFLFDMLYCATSCDKTSIILRAQVWRIFDLFEYSWKKSSLRRSSVGSGSPCLAFNRFAYLNGLQYVQEVVTLEKKYLVYLHQKMRFTPVVNYYNTLG